MKIKNLLAVVLSLSMAITARSQNLPNKQSISLRAPANINIDGKATEWNDHFQAYNHATDVFYTMANDDSNLYLVIQAKDPNIVSRILGGGITLTIQNEKKDKKNIAKITYPIVENSPYFNLRSKKEDDNSTRSADSLMMYNNALLSKDCKWILATGIVGLDSVLSVYNGDGIKAAGLFDNRRVYTCELSINLKLIKLSADPEAKFTYNIRINGAKPMGFIKPLSSALGSEAIMEGLAAKANEIFSQRSAPTDFWDEYTLAKK